MKIGIWDIFLNLMFNILKSYEFHNDLPVLPEGIKIEKVFGETMKNVRKHRVSTLQQSNQEGFFSWWG